jgi:hypothetical protein
MTKRAQRVQFWADEIMQAQAAQIAAMFAAERERMQPFWDVVAAGSVGNSTTQQRHKRGSKKGNDRDKNFLSRDRSAGRIQAGSGGDD